MSIFDIAGVGNPAASTSSRPPSGVPSATVTSGHAARATVSTVPLGTPRFPELSPPGNPFEGLVTGTIGTTETPWTDRELYHFPVLRVTPVHDSRILAVGRVWFTMLLTEPRLEFIYLTYWLACHYHPPDQREAVLLIGDDVSKLLKNQKPHAVLEELSSSSDVAGVTKTKIPKLAPGASTTRTTAIQAIATGASVTGSDASYVQGVLNTLAGTPEVEVLLYPFLALCVSRVGVKPTENVLSKWEKILDSFSKFYGISGSLNCDPPSKMSLSLLENNLGPGTVLFGSIIARAVLATDLGSEIAKGPLMFSLILHAAFTGIHPVSMAIRASQLCRVTLGEYLVMMTTPLVASSCEAVSSVIRNYEMPDEHGVSPTSYWMYARCFGTQYLSSVTTTSNREFTYMSAALIKSLSPKNEDPTAIVAVSLISASAKANMNLAVKKAINYIQGSMYSGTYANIITLTQAERDAAQRDLQLHAEEEEDAPWAPLP